MESMTQETTVEQEATVTVPFRMATAQEVLASQDPNHINKGTFRKQEPDGSYTYCRLGWLLEHAGFDFSQIGE